MKEFRFSSTAKQEGKKHDVIVFIHTWASICSKIRANVPAYMCVSLSVCLCVYSAMIRSSLIGEKKTFWEKSGSVRCEY